jgi:hypothetical protein
MPEVFLLGFLEKTFSFSSEKNVKAMVSSTSCDQSVVQYAGHKILGGSVFPEWVYGKRVATPVVV